MADDSAKPTDDFLTVACELGILSADSAQRLTDEATILAISPEHLALKEGLLSIVQADMVQTLQKPFDAIPGYEIQRVLGQGGMGVVYSARQTNLQRAVALKTVILSLMTDANAIARFQQEAVTVARLRHPNIIAAFDFGQHAGRLYFVMELIEGEDLISLIRRKGVLDEWTAWGLARQVVAGLSHAAQHGIVHRDIKPANLLLVTPPTGFPLPAGLPMVKIADFGLASLEAEEEAKTRLTAANMMLGSPHYMAPEQLTNTQVDLRADVYALGITVFQMLNGTPPFSGAVTQILAQKLRGELPDIRTLKPNVSIASAELIRAMTQTEPANRPGSYADLLERIDRVLQQIEATTSGYRTLNIAGTTTQLEPSAAITSLKNNVAKNRRSEWRAWLITAAVSCVILIAGVLVVRQRPKALPLLGPRLVSTGWREPLFNGTLNNWLAVSGQWGDATDDDGAKVLAGSDGSVRREFSRMTDGKRKPLDNYRITMGASLQEASALEVQFGILNVEQLEAPRTVCRIQRDGLVWLASRAADTSKLTAPATARKWKIEPDRSYSLDVQRCDKFWRVSFDGQPVGELPVADHPDRPEFRLAVEGGPAWFSDLEVEELIEQ